MPERIDGTEGMNEATAAFRASMDAEAPSRSRRPDREQKEQNRQDIEDVFPQRNMDRREEEGGANDDPEPVRRARAERGNRDFGNAESDDGPNDPEEEDGGLIEDEEEPEDDGQPEPDADEEDEEDQPEAAEIDPDQIVRVLIDGQPHEVSLGEAVKGYIRQETFHRRMGELSNGVTHLHHAKLGLDNERADFIEKSRALENYIEAFMPQEPNWDELYRANPTNFAYLKHQWDTFQGQFSGLVQQRQQAEYQRQTAYMERLNQFASANRATLAAEHPEWRSEKTWRRDTDSMRRTAKEAGYTDEEIGQLFDARAVRVLLMASRYQRMMAARPRPVRQQAPQSNRTGATPSRNVSRSFEKAEKRLSRTGSLNDAAAVFERILNSER
jgi:hypothetical protein